MTSDELTQAIAGARLRDERRGELPPAPKLLGAADDILRGDTDQQCQRDRRMLLAVIDQLLPDARRLDWILSDRARGQAIHVQGSELRGWSVIDMSDGVRILSRAPTPREAIDRAIEGAKK